MSKYTPLRLALLESALPGVEMSFATVSALVGGLPPSSRRYRQWWSNETKGRHVQAVAWREAGYEVEEVDLLRQLVRFRRR